MAATLVDAIRWTVADLEDNMNVRRLDQINDAAVARLQKYTRVWRMLKAIDLE